MSHYVLIGHLHSVRFFEIIAFISLVYKDDR